MIAQSPICSDVGSTPMRAVPIAIVAIVKHSTFCRPSRSPSGPSTSPPRGRTRNDTAKPSSVTSRPTDSSMPVVKTAVMVTAR